MAGVTYAVIATRHDQIVTPYTTQYLSGANVTNITIQDGCTQDRSDHLQIPYSPRALDHMLNALDPAHPRTPRCTAMAPVI